MEWCVEYHTTYKRAPRKDIEGIYYTWAEAESTNHADAEAVFDLLKSLSLKHKATEEDQNTDYLVAQFKQYMLGLKVTALKDSISLSLQRGEVDEAVNQIEGFRSHSVGLSTGCSPFQDASVWDDAFAEPDKSLIELPGAAQYYLGPAMTREGLIGIQGPDKRGKTFWCLEFAIRAVMQRKRVAFFSVGDLSQRQMLKRLAVRLEGVPATERQCGPDSPIFVPQGLRTGPSTGPLEGGLRDRVLYKKRIFNQPITRSCTDSAISRFVRGFAIKGDVPYFMLSTHANSSINVRGIEGILNSWEYEQGFIPDVIIIDYADILSPENNRKESRDQVNETWSAMRRLSQNRKCLILTPTQANAKAYVSESQSMANFSNDKRKNAHVTGMLALNQTEAEKQAQLMRLGWVVLRESSFSAGDQLYVGICPALARMMCFSATSAEFRRLGRDNKEEES